MKKEKENIFQKLLGLVIKKDNKEDLLEYLQEAQENNIIDSQEARMITGVLSVSEQKVRDVMIPSSQIISVEYDLKFDEVIKLVLDSGHSRFPVEKDDKIIGILLAKDLLIHIKYKTDFEISKAMRAAKFIPESKPLDILLKEFRYQREHMVIVTNEYGGTAGLVTIEDVLEEIVGDIDDEHDIKNDKNIKKLDLTSYFVTAMTELDEFNSTFGVELSHINTDTIGGFVVSKFAYVPKIGEKINSGGFCFIVKEADERKIISLVVKKIKITNN